MNHQWSTGHLVGFAGRQQTDHQGRAGLPAWPVVFLAVPIFGFAIVGSYLAFQRWPNIAPRVVPKPPRKQSPRTA